MLRRDPEFVTPSLKRRLSHAQYAANPDESIAHYEKLLEMADYICQCQCGKIESGGKSFRINKEEVDLSNTKKFKAEVEMGCEKNNVNVKNVKAELWRYMLPPPPNA